MRKTWEAAAELGTFHDVRPIVTLTCQKSVLWVRGTASKQLLCSLLHKNGDVFMESLNTDQKDKLLTFLVMHVTCHGLRRRVERLRRSVYPPKMVQLCVRILFA